MRGPRGRGVGHTEGPLGGERTTVRGPGGRTASHVEGPRGREATFVGRRPPGYYPGRRYYHTLPSHHWHRHFDDNDYYFIGVVWYRPHYSGGTVVYYEVPPPAGLYVETLPAGYRVIVINGRTYYYLESVYYVVTTKDSKMVYIVVDRPANSPIPAETAAPNPLEVLQQMGKQLAGLQKFRLQTIDTMDEFLISGQKIQLTTHRTISVSRPNSVLADVAGDRKNRKVWYDGRTLSAFDRSRSMYAAAAMPDTIDAMIDKLAADYGMTIPTADLFYADPYKALIENVQSSSYVGLHKVGNVPCHHLAFSQENIDWEVWIEAGKRPLPWQVRITYKNSPGSPKYTSTMTKWEPSVAFYPDYFKFSAPAGAKQIPFMPIRKGASP
ncbi:hypothetical protein ES707_14729 [subsurface metagenome]